jgi:hypothetical protein
LLKERWSAFYALFFARKMIQISVQAMTPKSRQPIEKAIKNRIYGKRRGWVFTPRDFLDLGSEDSIWPALSRLEEKGLVRRLNQGLYDYPKLHKVLGVLPPDVAIVAEAVARKFQVRVQPTGAYAANILGLSEQVPGKVIFLTDGSSRSLPLKGMQIRFKKAAPKRMAVAGTISGLVFEALRSLGSKQITSRHIKLLKNKLSLIDKKRLSLDAHLAPAWISQIVRNELCFDQIKRVPQKS